MKALLSALAVLVPVATLAAPAFAFDRAETGAFVAIQYRDGGWNDGGWQGRDDGWRDRGGWRDRRGWDDRGDMLSEGQVARRLMRQGFVRIDDIDLRRDRYIVRAVRPNGALIRLAVDAYDGGILARERIGWVAGDRGFDRSPRRPANGVEFDLGGGTLGIYSR